MLARILFSLCIVALLAIALWSSLSGDDGSVVELDVEATEVEAAPQPLAPLAQPERSDTDRQPAAAIPDVAPAAPVADSSEAGEAPSRILIEGRVYDLQGVPVAGVSVGQVDSERRVVTGSDGRFRLDFETERTAQRLRADDPRWTTVYECQVALNGLGREHFIVVAPAIELGGHVLDEAGQGVVWPSVTIDHLGLVAADFPLPLDGNRLVSFRASSKEDGSFTLKQAPRVSGGLGVKLRATQKGYEPTMIALPAVTTHDLSIVLTSIVDEGPKLRGIVLLPDGDPAVGARVRLGDLSAQTGDDGRYALPLVTQLDDELPLAAGLDDHAPALIERYGATVNAAQPLTPPEAVLQLGPALAIGGVLLDQTGEPASGWQIQLHDGTEISRMRFPPELAEKVGKGIISASTKADGKFRLTNLLPRDYTLLARNQKTLQTFYSDPIPAGDTDVVLRVPPGGLHDSVQGVVVDLSGLPVEHASVSVGLILYRTSNGYSSTALRATVTDAEGKFVLNDVPKEHVHFNVGGDAVTPQMFEWSSEMDPQALVLEIARRCHFRLKYSGDESESLSYAIVDEAGEELQITTYQAGGSSSSTRQPLEAGDSPVRSISQNAQQLRVFERQELIHEQTIWLDPSDVTEIVVELP
jgi:hypothetical protein